MSKNTKGYRGAKKMSKEEKRKRKLSLEKKQKLEAEKVKVPAMKMPRLTVKTDPVLSKGTGVVGKLLLGAIGFTAAVTSIIGLLPPNA